MQLVPSQIFIIPYTIYSTFGMELESGEITIDFQNPCLTQLPEMPDIPTQIEFDFLTLSGLEFNKLEGTIITSVMAGKSVKLAWTPFNSDGNNCG